MARRYRPFIRRDTATTRPLWCCMDCRSRFTLDEAAPVALYCDAEDSLGDTEAGHPALILYCYQCARDRALNWAASEETSELVIFRLVSEVMLLRLGAPLKPPRDTRN
jgi:hypothetical protein